VTVSVAKEANGVVLRVADCGRGISPDFMPYVFDRFRQEDGTIARKQGGLGLGLAIAKSLVEQHGGTISAHSEGLGKGAVFTVVLPESDGMEVVPTKQDDEDLASDGSDQSLAGVRVLVVDDDDEMQSSLRDVLMQAGAQVAVAASVRTAFDMLTREMPDVLVSDIDMPVENGYDLIAKVRSYEKEHGLSRLPAIAATSTPCASERAKLFRAGFTAYLSTPIDAAELVALVESLSRA
jgi:CheY-like chemotaxis protein